MWSFCGFSHNVEIGNLYEQNFKAKKKKKCPKPKCKNLNKNKFFSQNDSL